MPCVLPLQVGKACWQLSLGWHSACVDWLLVERLLGLSCSGETEERLVHFLLALACLLILGLGTDMSCTLKKVSGTSSSVAIF